MWRVALLLLLAVPAWAGVPVYFGAASVPADNGSQLDNATVTITPPGSMTAGQLVVVIGSVQDTTADFTVAVDGDGCTGTAGVWNGPIHITGANDADMDVFWCQFDGAWGANPQFTFGSETGNQAVTAVMLVYTPDTAATWRIDTNMAGGAEASADPVVVSGVTPNKRDTVTLAGIAVVTARTASISGTGWVAAGDAQYRNTGGTDLTAVFAHQLDSGAPAATGDVSFDLDSAAAGVSFTMVWYNDQTPTIALNTADATDFGADTTPTLEFTGTDPNTDDVRYGVQISTSSTFEAVADSYSEANRDSLEAMSSAYRIGTAQSFTGDGRVLDSATFYLAVGAGYPTGTISFKIYAHSGVFGTSSIPTGAALATAETTEAVLINSYFSLIRLTFVGANRITLTNGTKYVTSVEYSGGDALNYVGAGLDTSSTSHDGNYSTLTGSTWTPSSTIDAIFYVYTMATEVTLFEISGTDSGFANTVSGGDTDPFNNAEKVSFTVQGGDALTTGTWYWRARSNDPNGGDTYSAWPTARSFTVTAVAPTERPKRGWMSLD